MRAPAEARLSPHVGAASLVMVFTVLCLTVLAALSMAAAKAELRLAESLKESVCDYYKADTAAEELAARLRAGEAVPGAQTDENGGVSFCVIISDELRLCAQLDKAGSVLSWRTEFFGPWSPEDKERVYDTKR